MKMNFSCSVNMILACDNKYGIGFNEMLPNWNLKNDLYRFKRLTIGEGNNFVIMGKTTWISLNKRPLQNRTNIILSTTLDKNTKYDNVIIKSSKEEIYKYIEQHKKENSQVWIIGGAQVYKSYLQEVNKIYWSHTDDCFSTNVFLDDEVIRFLNKQKWNLQENCCFSETYDNYKFKVCNVKK